MDGPNGDADHLAVLVAKNEPFAAELAAVGSEVDSLMQIVAVCAAPGGGWLNAAAIRAPQPGT